MTDIVKEIAERLCVTMAAAQTAQIPVGSDQWFHALAVGVCEVMARSDGELVAALREAQLALETIARRVFNDNGDHTINTEALDPDVYSACYYASQTVADALAHRSSGHEG